MDTGNTQHQQLTPHFQIDEIVHTKAAHFGTIFSYSDGYTLLPCYAAVLNYRSICSATKSVLVMVLICSTQNYYLYSEKIAAFFLGHSQKIVSACSLVAVHELLLPLFVNDAR